MNYYDYTTPYTRDLDYPINHTSFGPELMGFCDRFFNTVLPDLDKANLVADKGEGSLIAGLRLYIYFLNNPTMFGHNADNIIGHIFQTMKRARLSLVIGISTIGDQRYFRVPNKYVYKNKDTLLTLFDIHLSENKSFYEKSLPTTRKLTEEEMITQYLSKHNPTICEDNLYPSSTPNYTVKHKNFLNLDQLFVPE